MRSALVALLAILTAVRAGESAPAGRHEIDNVWAFARLYGVVRYFYPSDAAASLDWNRLAVHGVQRVRLSADAARLEAALEALFAPLGPGIEIGTTLPAPALVESSGEAWVAWRYLGPGSGGTGGAYAAKRTHRLSTTKIDGFVTLMQTAPAEALRGKRIRLRGQVRAIARDTSGSAALWLRVDGPNRAMGFFDNMGDRPIREPEWREYRIDGTVADDATAVAFGVMASGPVMADFDAVELAVKDPNGDWIPIPIIDAGFEMPADGRSGGWMRAGTSRTAQIHRPAEKAPEGHQFLHFAPAAGSETELFDGGSPTVAHVDVDLGSGLKARVPLALTDAQARTEAARQSKVETLRTALASVPGPSDTPDLDMRLADVVVAWNVFRHFYPYWAESKVDWDACLGRQLEVAYVADGRAAHGNALRALVADARDGHGHVADMLVREDRAHLPLRFGVLEDQLVIVASGTSSETPLGAVVSTIDGMPAMQRLAEAMRLASGTPQWRQARSLLELSTGRQDTATKLIIDMGTGGHEVTLRFDAKQLASEKRPEPLAELEPEVWYVDLTRASMAEVGPALDKLASARGVVFDVRGYPGDAGAGILPHLIDAPESDRWMHVAKLVGPFGQSAGWQSFGWDLKPVRPRLAGKTVFLTDGRAISYAESVMGYVADRKLGVIVGSTTAGTNGNVASFVVPSGFRLGLTGMRVTGHDGQTPHHLVGIKPDIAVAPTIQGFRAGRDEVLERATALIRATAR